MLPFELWAKYTVNKNRLLSQTLTTGKYEGSPLFGAINTSPRGVQRILRVKIGVNRVSFLGDKHDDVQTPESSAPDNLSLQDKGVCEQLPPYLSSHALLYFKQENSTETCVIKGKLSKDYTTRGYQQPGHGRQETQSLFSLSIHCVIMGKQNKPCFLTSGCEYQMEFSAPVLQGVLFQDCCTPDLNHRPSWGFWGPYPAVSCAAQSGLMQAELLHFLLKPPSLQGSGSWPHAFSHVCACGVWVLVHPHTHPPALHIIDSSSLCSKPGRPEVQRLYTQSRRRDGEASYLTCRRLRRQAPKRCILQTDACMPELPELRWHPTLCLGTTVCAQK